MAFVLDDTEVNMPIYEVLERPSKMRKLRRIPLASRVQRLETSLRLLQERLLEAPIKDAQASEKAKSRGRK